MYKDVMVFIGKRLFNYEKLEDILTGIPNVPDYLFLSSVAEAESFFSVIVPGCIIIEESIYNEGRLTVLLHSLHEYGCLVYLYGVFLKKQYPRKNQIPDGFLNESNLISMTGKMLERLSLVSDKSPKFNLHQTSLVINDDRAGVN